MAALPAHTHVRAALAYLARCGAEDVAIGGGRRIKLAWRHETHTMAIVLSRAPCNGQQAATIARQQIRREYRAAGVEVGAA